MASKKKASSSASLPTNSLSSELCEFCQTSQDDELIYGKFLKSKGIFCHSNCLFFSSGLEQSGDENNGLSGFTPTDIRKELLRGKRLVCSFCHKKGATIGCVNSRCKKTFHYPCGIKRNTLHQFYDSFNSYCADHKPKQKFKKIPTDLTCKICLDGMNPSLEACINSPCCSNGWFHFCCMQKYAYNAGLHFFSCPLCKNSDKFISEMRTFGINIPDKDAEWELEDNAYEELLVRPACNAVRCVCKKGRKFNSSKNRQYKLLICAICGGEARHVACANNNSSVKRWLCRECQSTDEIKAKKQSDPALNSSKSQVKSDYSGTGLESSSAHDKEDIIGSVQLKPLIIICSKANISDLISTERENCTSDCFTKTNCPRKSNYKKLYSSDSTIQKTADENENPKEHVFENTHSSQNTHKHSSSKELNVRNKYSNENIFDNVASGLMNLNTFSSSKVNAFSLLKSPVISHTVKRNKRKIEHVCNKDKLCCLKKYFKNESGNFRL